MLILLAVTWAAGSLLLAAEWNAPSRRPASSETVQEKVTTAALAQSAPSESGQAAQSEGATQEPEGQNSSAGQEEQKEAEAQAGAPAPESANPEAGTDEAGTDEEEQAPPPPKDGQQRASPQRFVPSEQVRADFDVSFPIDI
jgi:cobalamin biosynthesis protein CobT